MKKIVCSLIVVAVAVAAFALFPATADSSSPPEFTVYVTTPIVTNINMVVTIPDPNLRAALHDLTGVPDNESLHLADLWGLTGAVNISDKNIANADGIQHCINIDYLDMSRNPITNLPSMAGMTKLKTLRLTGCNLGAWPEGKLPPNLQTLSLSKNNISVLPATMTDPAGTWKNLDLSTNKIEELPGWLLGLTGLIMLDLSHNDLGEIPSGISGLTHLEQLYVSDNGLESLPDVLCDMSNLHDLVAARNSLYSLPEDIGDHLYTLSVPYNRIERLPNSIGDSPSLYLIDVRLNRLTSLPSNFDDHAWDFINVEFNFIDMSSGTTERTMVDNMTSMEKYYKRQLKPVANLTAAPGSDSITLTWEGGESGADGTAEWTVTGYVVYLYDGSMVKLDDVDADTLTYTITGLTPETEYQYRVGVNYDVVAPGYDVSTRGYTRITVSTTAVMPSPTAAESTSEAATTEAVTASAAEASLSATPEAQPAEGSAASPGMPVWLIVTIAAVGALALGAGAMLLILKLKK